MKRFIANLDECFSGAALALMVAVPLLEITLRLLGAGGVDNAAVLVQHLGLLMTMSGAVAAERHGHLTALGTHLDSVLGPRSVRWLACFANAGTALLCGSLAQAAWVFVAAERPASPPLAYGLPLWWVQACMPLGFALLALRFGARLWSHPTGRWPLAVLPGLAGWWLATQAETLALPLGAGLLVLLLLLLAGAPVFALLGGLALLLFAGDGLPLASVPLSQYQITVNPSLPALPLFTLAGLVLARTAAAQRIGALFLALFGSGVHGSVLATALICSAFTALTGGSGVTILALGGLLLPLLMKAGYPEQRGIGLVTSASALGVLLAPSVPFILYAVLARVPIADMFLAGLLPALLMVACLLFIGGYWRSGAKIAGAESQPASGPDAGAALRAAWDARWELLAPFVALGSLLGGVATPTEAAALTAGYALLTQGLLRRELTLGGFSRALADGAQIIGGVMLILGMALALTNFMVDAGIPDLAVEWVQQAVPNKYLFLLLLCVFLFIAAALMEIYAAIIVLVPLLLPLARAYGIDPVHFGIIFLAAMEAGFLCPPAGMNIYFASAMFKKPIAQVARSVLPALAAIFAGTVLIALLPPLSTALPTWWR